MGNLFSHKMVKDGEEYELDLSYTYHHRGISGIQVNIDQVVNTKTCKDIDPEAFEMSLTEEESQALQVVCDEYQEAREGTDWR